MKLYKQHPILRALPTPAEDATMSDVAAYLADRGMVALNSTMVKHLISVSESVTDLCEPKMRKGYDDPTEHDGGLALHELGKVISIIKAAGEQQ